MSKKIEVHTGELSKSANRIEKHLQNFFLYINQLYNENLYQLGNGWKGKENLEFVNHFTDYLSDLQKLGNSVVDYIAFLRIAAQHYEDTVTESAVRAKGGQ